MRKLLLLLSLCLPVIGYAQLPLSAEQGNPYEARIPVDDQSAASRDPALRDALATVVMRVSGDDAPYVAGELINQAPQLVLRYGYERDAENQMVLVAAFEPRTLDSRLKALGLPVWGVYAAAVEEIPVTVNGIAGRDAYQRVIALFSGLPNVQNVAVESATGQQLQLRIKAEGGAGRLNGAVMASGGLSPDYDTGGRLSYRMTAGGEAFYP